MQCVEDGWIELAPVPRSLVYQIFDSKVLHLLEPRYSTSEPFKSDTLEGLVKQLKVDHKQAVRTLEDYNAAAQHGVYISYDDGASWPHRLLLDERERVSYPDAVEGPDGLIRIVYDFNRFDNREIIMATVAEQDILAGKASSSTQLKMLINKAGV